MCSVAKLSAAHDHTYTPTGPVTEVHGPMSMPFFCQNNLRLFWHEQRINEMSLVAYMMSFILSLFTVEMLNRESIRKRGAWVYM